MGKQKFSKKSLGQHFLIDKNIARKIVTSANISTKDTILEIGPGKGILTKEILKKGKKLIAFEIDKNLFKFLQNEIKNEKFILLNTDALLANFNHYAHDTNLKIVSNLPYYLTSPFIFKCINNKNLFSSITLMIQDEVAERIIALPGCKNYGILSIKSQIYFKVKRFFKVPPYVFRPKPKINSAVIQMIPRSDIPKIPNKRLFFDLIDHTFQQRRKMLRKSLKKFLSSNQLQKLSTNENIDLSLRPEDLTIKDFINLVEIIN